MRDTREKKFIADAFVSREYRSAVILEEYLQEINNPEATRYAIKVLQRFNKVFKDIKNLKHKEYIANLIVVEYEKKINADVWVPEFVRTLMLNIIKTKYKTEILEYGKGKNLARKD
jgi:hypothetical protein